MMPEHIVTLKSVAPSELLSEEEALKNDATNPFLSIRERPEPYRSLFLAQARLKPVYQREKVQAPVVVNTPRGRGLIWRWWADQIGVVLFHKASNGRDTAVDDTVTFLSKEERARVTIDLSVIVLNPPKW